MIYPFARIQQQLVRLYCQSGFENLLRHWANHSTFDNLLTDIYDGKIWQTFKEMNELDSPNFFDQKW